MSVKWASRECVFFRNVTNLFSLSPSIRPPPPSYKLFNFEGARLELSLYDSGLDSSVGNFYPKEKKNPLDQQSRRAPYIESSSRRMDLEVLGWKRRIVTCRRRRRKFLLLLLLLMRLSISIVGKKNRLTGQGRLILSRSIY